jgi:hypothetical protein
MRKQQAVQKKQKQPRLKLERGFVPPERHSYDFETFQKGHSLLIETKGEMLKVRNAAYAWARRHNKKNESDPTFAPVEFRCCRMETGGWRLFRTE